MLVSGKSTIDWYTDIAGQPVPLSSLGAADRTKAERLLADRLLALRDLAARHADDPAAAALAAAVIDPPTDAIYVINGQPVIVGWGRPGNGVPLVPPVAAAIPVATAPIAAAAAVPLAATAAGGRFPWRLVGGLAALALLAALLWWLWPLLMGGLGLSTDDRLAALTAEETALTAEIAAAEAELRRRLAACPVPEASAPAKEPPVQEIPAAPPPVVTPDKPEPVTPEPVTRAPETPPPVLPSKPPVKKPSLPPQAQPQPPKQQAKAEAPPPPACPPPRKKWEAPELVVLLDASGSMGLKAGGGGDRLSAAKDAVNRMLTTLPGDMDVGMVVFGHCQGADNHKFFSPAERPRLKSLLDSIRPMEGTPLARGIERAGNTVDGVSVPATLVVVTDGEDSCGGDPCAAARALKAAKPKITINVVDVGGQGRGSCMAQATGGRVLPMKSAAELPELIRKASGETPVPPGCGGS